MASFGEAGLGHPPPSPAGVPGPPRPGGAGRWACAGRRPPEEGLEGGPQPELSPAAPGHPSRSDGGGLGGGAAGAGGRAAAERAARPLAAAAAGAGGAAGSGAGRGRRARVAHRLLPAALPARPRLRPRPGLAGKAASPAAPHRADRAGHPWACRADPLGGNAPPARWAAGTAAAGSSERPRCRSFQFLWVLETENLDQAGALRGDDGPLVSNTGTLLWVSAPNLLSLGETPFSLLRQKVDDIKQREQLRSRKPGFYDILVNSAFGGENGIASKAEDLKPNP